MKATGFSKMTKTERVMATMALQETDRTPVYDILLNDALIEHFTGKYPPVGEEGLKLKCKAISRMFDMTRMAGFAPDEPGEETDEYGFVSRHGRWLHMGIHHRPFHDERGAVEWLRRYTDKLGAAINLQEIRKDFTEDFSKQRRYIGYNHGLMHSPAWLRSVFFPRIKDLNDAWHEHGIKCLFHSDGNIMSVMDDLMDTGRSPEGMQDNPGRGTRRIFHWFHHGDRRIFQAGECADDAEGGRGSAVTSGTPEMEMH